MDAKLHNRVELNYFYPAERDSRAMFPVAVDIFGLVIITDLLVRDAPCADAPEGINVWRF